MAVNQINLTGLPLDSQAQQSQLQIQQAIAQALVSQGMQQNSSVVPTAGGNPYGYNVPNFGDPIANVVNAMQGREQMAEVAKKQSALAEETQRTTQQDIAEALALRKGSAGEQLPEGMGSTPGTPGNFNSYVERLLKSRVPEVRKIGEEAIKKMLTPQDMAQYSDKYKTEGLDTAARTGDYSGLQTKPKIETFEGSSRALNTDTGQAVGPSVAINQYDPMAINPLGIATQKSSVTGRETAPGPQGDVSTEKSFETLNASAQIEMLKKSLPVFQQNQQNMGTIQQALEEMKTIPEAEFGFAGPLKTTIGKVGEALGFAGLTSTSSKESLTAVLGNLTLQKVRALAPVTEHDLDEIKRIIGSEGMTKRSVARVMEIMQNATEAEMKRHIQQVDIVSEKIKDPTQRDQFKRAWHPDYIPNLVPTPGGSPYKDMTDDDIRKRLRGG